MDGSKGRKMPAGLGSWLVLRDFRGHSRRGGGERKPDSVGVEELEAAQIHNSLG